MKLDWNIVVIVAGIFLVTTVLVVAMFYIASMSSSC